MSAERGLRVLGVPERGSEIVQSVVAVSLVLLVVFAAVQAGGMMLSINRLTADLSRACRQMDTAGLALAVDRERFVANEVLGAATQLKPELLTVANVQTQVLGEARGTRPSAGAARGESGDGGVAKAGTERREEEGSIAYAAGDEEAGIDAGAGVVQRTDAVRVSFDVRYELPSLAAMPGLSHRTIARHVVCEQVAGRIVEVEVGM